MSQTTKTKQQKTPRLRFFLSSTKMDFIQWKMRRFPSVKYFSSFNSLNIGHSLEFVKVWNNSMLWKFFSIFSRTFTIYVGFLTFSSFWAKKIPRKFIGTPNGERTLGLRMMYNEMSSLSGMGCFDSNAFRCKECMGLGTGMGSRCRQTHYWMSRCTLITTTPLVAEQLTR